MRSSHFVGVLFMACLPLGCSSWQVENDSRHDVGSNELPAESVVTRLIASDFVNALQQIPSLPPSATTVQLLHSELYDPFTLRMRDALQEAGYGTRWVKEGAHAQLFQYRHESGVDDASRPQELYEVAVGSVELRRRYATDEHDRVSPVTPLYVRGADASGIQMNDSHFELLDNASQLAQTSKADATKPVAVTSSQRQTAPSAGRSNQLSVPNDANPLNPLVSGADRNRDLSLPLVALPRVENVFELGGSNYQALLSDHLLVREQILTFANDSLRLGAVNKILVEQMVESFQPETDVFSVLGCSLGPTSLQSGNAALALGRASRVREALLFAGVPQDRIFDEGCWAGDSSDKALPRRGVVVTLNRKT